MEDYLLLGVNITDTERKEEKRTDKIPNGVFTEQQLHSIDFTLKFKLSVFITSLKASCSFRYLSPLITNHY